SQGEEGGDAEDRSQRRGLRAAEPATGSTEVNADRTAEQRLGDPGAGLRGHDSRLPVSHVQSPPRSAAPPPSLSPGLGGFGISGGSTGFGSLSPGESPPSSLLSEPLSSPPDEPSFES